MPALYPGLLPGVFRFQGMIADFAIRQEKKKAKHRGR